MLSPSEEVALAVATAVATTVLGVAVARRVLLTLPSNYFVRPDVPRGRGRRVFRFALGVALIVLGVALLFLPGQGLLTILFGIALLDTRKRLLISVLRRPHVARALSAARKKAGREPFELP